MKNKKINGKSSHVFMLLFILNSNCCDICSRLAGIYMANLGHPNLMPHSVELGRTYLVKNGINRNLDPPHIPTHHRPILYGLAQCRSLTHYGRTKRRTVGHRFRRNRRHTFSGSSKTRNCSGRQIAGAPPYNFFRSPRPFD